MLNIPTYRGVNGLGVSEAIMPVIKTVGEAASPPSTPAIVAPQDYVPLTDEEWQKRRAIDADKTMSMVIRFPGMLLAGIGQWALNRTRSTDNYVDPMAFATDEKNKSLTWALALVAWGGIGWGVYSLFFKKGGN